MQTVPHSGTARPANSPHLPRNRSVGAGAAAGSKEGQASAVTFPYPGSLCVHASERRQQEFEYDAVFSGESTQVTGVLGVGGAG